MKNSRPKYKQIIDAALVVIAQNGYHQAQVSKIAKQAGVADGTIYLYFKNKEDILISLFQENMGYFIEQIQEGIAEKSSAVDQLFVLIQKHFQILAENMDLAIVTQLELRQTRKELRYRINQVLKGYLTLLDNILIKGIENGEFLPNLNIKLARNIVFGTIDEIATTWVMKNQKYSLIALAPEVHQLLTKGFVPNNECGFL